MKFNVFLLLIGGFSHLWGNPTHLGSDHTLECLNDYLFTITCVLNISAEVLPHSATSWLEFYDYLDMSQGHRCMLKAEKHAWVCVLDVSPWLENTFSDTDTFQISLTSSYHGNSSSVVLEMYYMPVKHIRPVPPTNLSLLWETDRAVFRWLSGYQGNIYLDQNLQYQLSICSKDQALDVSLHDVKVAVEVSRFSPHTTYIARVRSVPSNVYYKGVWSQWGSAIHWTTGAIHNTPDTLLASRWFALLCLLPVLLLFYTLYSWCKRQVLIPSPTPYFKDFKSLAMQPDELLQREESLKIDTMFEGFDNAPQPSSTPLSQEGYSGHAFIPGSPKSHSLPLCTKGVEVSSCSLQYDDDMTAESSSVTFSEDYCSLSLTLSTQAHIS